MPSILSNRDKLKEAIDKTNSTSEALVYLGLRNAGGNFQTFHKYCALYGLTEKDSISVKIRSLRKFKPSNLEDILKENSTTQSSKLRPRLLAEGLLKNECYECKLGPRWNGKELSLQLDHMNGIHSDNRIENLRILCPNCHTQTNNFGSKNASFEKKTYQCEDCGGKRVKGSKSNLCYTCSSKKRRKVLNRPSREEIQEQVDKLGYLGTARIYGVSDNAIRKWISL